MESRHRFFSGGEKAAPRAIRKLSTAFSTDVDNRNFHSSLSLGELSPKTTCVWICENRWNMLKIKGLQHIGKPGTPFSAGVVLLSRIFFKKIPSGSECGKLRGCGRGSGAVATASGRRISDVAPGALDGSRAPTVWLICRPSSGHASRRGGAAPEAAGAAGGISLDHCLGLLYEKGRHRRLGVSVGAGGPTNGRKTRVSAVDRRKIWGPWKG